MRTRFLTIALVSLGLAGGLAPVTSVRAAQDDGYPYQGRTDFSLDGTVRSVDVDRDRVIVTGDNGRSYTVDTYQSAIVLRGTSRSGETGDLVPGMRLHITGTLVSGDIVEADRVAVQPYRSARPTVPAPGRRTEYPPPYRDMPGNGEDAQGFSLRGTVESVNNRRSSFVVRVNDHTRTVYVNDSTDMSDFGSDTGDRLPFRVGDRVSVVGVLQDDGTVTADSVSRRPLSDTSGYQNDSPSRNDSLNRPGNQIRGVVIQTSNRYTTRDIKVRLSSGHEITVHVPKNIPIRRDGRSISVHELSSDDEVRIDGRYDGDDFRATRIDVTGNYARDEGGYLDDRNF